VLPEFQKNIAGNYPLVKDTLNSISIPNFTRFFGPKGTMNTFFNYYIKPFVDTSQVYWVWKDVDGQHLNIAQNNLELFIKAELIQKMFIFGNNDLTSSFVMEPVEMSPNTQFFMLNLSNHFVSYRSGPRKADHIFWSAQSNQSISIEFVSTQGKHEISSISADPWALLRIFDKANIHPAGTPGHFELTFDLNGNSIMYQIISDQPVNPFVPEIMTNFQCPSKL
jgi:type VI secretion system protein ImpL